MEKFKTAKEVAKYLQNHKWRGKGRKEPITERAVQMHVKAGLLKKGKDGLFSSEAVNDYASANLEDDASLVEKTSLADEIKREQIRKLKLENDRKAGDLVLLSEEIKRRVSVLQDIKAGLVNHRSDFTRQLSQMMKKRHPENELLSDLLIDASELWEDAVLTAFDAMGKERGL